MTTQRNSSVSYDSSPLSTRHLERAMRRVLGVAVTLIAPTRKAIDVAIRWR